MRQFAERAAPSGNKTMTTGEFDINCYLGEWFELARLPTPFEMGLTNVKANYSRLPGTDRIKVVNEGTDFKTGQIQKAIGSAVPSPTEDGVLFVSFSGNGYQTPPSKYIVLDTDYCNFSVVGSESGLLWFLVRERDNIKNFRYVQRMADAALNNGYSESDLERLIW